MNPSGSEAADPHQAHLLENLPPSLRLEINLFLSRRIIEKVPLFQGAGDAFVRHLACSLTPVIFAPGDFIIGQGDIGQEMYFISRGTVEVSAGSGEVYANLAEGDFLGRCPCWTRNPAPPTSVPSTTASCTPSTKTCSRGFSNASPRRPADEKMQD